MSLYFLDFWRRFGLALGASGDWLPQLIEMSESLQLRQPFLLLPMTVMTMMMTLRLFPTSQHLRSSIVISATSWRQRPLARSLARRFISVTRRPRWARRDVALLSNAGWGWRFPCGRVAGAYSRHVWRPGRAGPNAPAAAMMNNACCLHLGTNTPSQRGRRPADQQTFSAPLVMRQSLIEQFTSCRLSSQWQKSSMVHLTWRHPKSQISCT